VNSKRESGGDAITKDKRAEITLMMMRCQWWVIGGRTNCFRWWYGVGAGGSGESASKAHTMRTTDNQPRSHRLQENGGP